MGETCSVCNACTDQQEIRTANTNHISRIITKNKITNKNQNLSNNINNNINNINILNQPKISIKNIHYNNNVSNNNQINTNPNKNVNNNKNINNNPINNKRNVNKKNNISNMNLNINLDELSDAQKSNQFDKINTLNPKYKRKDGRKSTLDSLSFNEQKKK